MNKMNPYDVYERRGTKSVYVIETQDTQPLPSLQYFKPSMAQLRQWCGMNPLEVAKASGVRYSKVYRMEHGMACRRSDILRVLEVFSRHMHCVYRIEHIRGLHVLDSL